MPSTIQVTQSDGGRQYPLQIRDERDFKKQCQELMRLHENNNFPIVFWHVCDVEGVQHNVKSVTLPDGTKFSLTKSQIVEEVSQS